MADCTLGPLVDEAAVAAGAAYTICEANPSALVLAANDLEIIEEGNWCSYQPIYTVPDIAGYLPTLVTTVKDIVYEELWAQLQAQIAGLEANAAMVYSTKLERITSDAAMAGKIDASYAQWESGSAALASSVQTALASTDYALSQQILQTEATLDGKLTANSEFYQTSLASVGETMAASGVLNSVTLADGKKVVSGFRSQASSTTGSEFTIFADTFKILNRVPNGLGGYDYSSVVAPFTVQNDTVYIGAVNTSEPQITYLGEFASAPSTAGLDKNVVYKNTTDGNTYLYNGTEWTIWIPAAEGQGVVSAFIFTRSAKQPDTPSGGSWTSMLPTSLNVTFGGSSADADGATGIVWSDGVPADNGKPLWTATKWFTSNNQPPYEGPMWNTPTVLADTPKQNFQWNTSLAFPGDPGPTGTSNGWTDSAIGAVWIAGSTTFNHATQSWSNWSVAKVKGEDGVDGEAGAGVNIIFKVSSSNTVAPTITGTGALPTGWSDGIGQTYSTTSPTNPYLWYAKGTGIAGIWAWGVPTLNTATNIAELKLYKLNDATMSTAGSYNFGTATLSGYETGWTTSVPALVNNGDRVYTTTAVVTGAKDSVVTPSWSTPVVYAQRTDGATGATGAAGSRGSAILNYSTDLGSVAATAVGSATLAGYWDIAAPSWQDNEIAGDVLILTNTNTSSGWTNIYTYNGTAWVNNTKLVVNGDAVVTGTLAAGAIKSGGVLEGVTIKVAGTSNVWNTNGDMYVSNIKGVGNIVASGDINCKNFTAYGTISGIDYSDVGAAASSHSHTASSITSWSSLSVSGAFSCTNTTGAWFSAGGSVGVNSQVSSTSSYGFQTNGKIKSVLYNGFTGSHLGFMTSEPVVGDIVSVTGKMYHYGVNENYAVLEMPSAAKDRRVFGVVSDYATEDIASKLEVDTLFYDTVATTTMEDIVTEELDDGGEIVEVVVQQPRTEYVRVLKYGYADTVADILAESDVLVYTNSVGEGGINVCSENGNIEVGDYICSSNTPGKGMKQDDDLLHNYTVAKALESVDWSTEESTTKMIACTYHCG